MSIDLKAFVHNHSSNFIHKMTTIWERMLVSTCKHSICCSTIILCIQKHSPIRCSKQRVRQAQSSSTSFPHKKSSSSTYNAASQSAFGCLKALLSSPILSTPPYQSQWSQFLLINQNTKAPNIQLHNPHPRRKRVHSSIYAVLIRIIFSIVRKPYPF